MSVVSIGASSMQARDGRPRCSVLLPGDWSTPTGGYRYDRKIAQGLEAIGWQLTPLRLEGRFPQPDETAHRAADRVLRDLPDGHLVIADGLAFGALPALAEAHAGRLVWVALVHHPLHLETGLEADTATRLRTNEARALAHARQVVVTSRRTVADVVALGVPAERIEVIEPGVDRVTEVALPGAEPEPGRLLCVATLTRRKNHIVLLRAVAGLGDRDWTLDLVGSAEHERDTAAELRQLAQDLGLQDRLRWHGAVDAGAVAQHHRQAALQLLASHHEGYGMVIAEGLAQGLPAYVADAGALRDTLPAGAGVHLPPDDVAAWTAALARWLDDPAWRAACRQGARAAAARLPDWAGQAQRWDLLLHRVLAAAAGSGGTP